MRDFSGRHTVSSKYCRVTPGRAESGSMQSVCPAWRPRNGLPARHDGCSKLSRNRSARRCFLTDRLHECGCVYSSKARRHDPDLSFNPAVIHWWGVYSSIHWAHLGNCRDEDQYTASFLADAFFRQDHNVYGGFMAVDPDRLHGVACRHVDHRAFL